MSRPIRHALVLAAGLGTRLRPLTTVRAKPAIPVAGDPIVRRIARWLAGSGVTDLVVNLHHLPATIASVLGDGSDLGARVRYSWEQPVVLGSAGGPRLALPLLEADTFFIVNGDTLTDVDLGHLAAVHDADGAPAAAVTLALTPNRDPARYGGVCLDDQSRVVGFVGRGSSVPSFHFIGVQAASSGAFRSLPERQVLNSIGDVYNRLLESRPGSVRGFVSDAAFWDVGTVSDYINTCAHFHALETDPPARSVPPGQPGIDITARLTRSIVWNDVEVGANAELDACILTDGVRVPAGAAYQRAILMRGADGALDVIPLVDDRGDPHVDTYLRDAGLLARKPKVVPLTGDASDRRYFRIILPDAPSIVLALHAGPIDFDTLPFANVAELLRHLELPVPAILGHSNAQGIVALEDLGDVTLQAHLGAASPTEHAALYRDAVSLIEQLQRRGSEPRWSRSGRYLPYQVAFDVEKLTWELNFFVRHFLEAYRGVALSPAEHAALADEWAAIATELASEPRVLCHRDYHSRNLMLHGGRLHIIDFQDARMGPDTYDLASLLRDSYVDFTDVELDELIAYFLALRTEHDAALFRRRFDLMALQRNLKALGTFGYQTTTRGNPVYIQDMPRTLRYARTTLARHDRFARLRGVLAPHLDELRYDGMSREP